MVADRTLGRVDEQAGELGTHWVSAVVAQFGEAFDRHAAEGGGGGIVMEDCAGQFAVEAFDVAGELGEAEVDQAVKLAHAITEVLHQPVTQANELAQLLGGGVGQPRGRGALLCGEAGDAQGVDGVGLGALQILAGEAMGAQRIEQRHREAACGQRGKQILPVMAGGFHGHQHFARRTEHGEQFLIARGVLGEGRRFDLHRAVRADHRDHVGLGGDVDSGESHKPSWRRRKSGASEPVRTSTLVHARTRRCRPRDTVRTSRTGRGRQSHARGRCLSAGAATLSRIPSRSILTRVIR
jgi:hypothetical protein